MKFTVKIRELSIAMENTIIKVLGKNGGYIVWLYNLTCIICQSNTRGHCAKFRKHGKP